MNKSIIIFIATFFCMQSFAMEKPFEEPSVSNMLQAEADMVRKAYQEHGFIGSNFASQVKIHYCDKQVSDAFAKDHGKNELFAFNDGFKAIYMSKSFEDVPAEQRQQAIAHEMGHIVVNRKKSINPHWWYIQAQQNGLVASAMGSFYFYCLYEFKNNKKAAKWAALFGSIMPAIAVNTLYGPDLIRDRDSVAGIRFPQMEKVEEIVCDMLAAHVMPNGGANGAALFETLMKVDGNRNGMDGDHPWTDTRIRYHEWIDKYQQWVKK